MRRESYIPYVIVLCLITYPIELAFDILLDIPFEPFVTHIKIMLPLAMAVGLYKVWKYEKSLNKKNNEY